MHSIDCFCKGYLKYLITMLFCCALLVIAKDQYENKLRRHASYGLEALIEKGEVRNLFVGSSLFRQGIDISILNEYAGDNYVLSYNGAQPVLECWLLEYLVEEGVRIDNLYVDMYPFTLTYEPGIEDEKIFSELDLRHKWSIYQTIVYPNDHSGSTFYRVFVSQNNEMLLTWPITERLVDQRFQDGGNVAYTAGMTDEVAQSLSVPDMGNSEIIESQKRALEQMIGLCRKENIHLVFLETPKYPTFSENDDYQEILGSYKDYLISKEIQFFLANDVCGDAMKDSEYFYDLLHLSSKGRSKYTLSIIEYGCLR